MKFLIINYNLKLLEDMRGCLRSGWPQAAIISNSDIGEGIEMVKTGSPDLVILGANSSSPGSDKIIRRIRKVSDVPVMVMLDSRNEQEKINCFEAGADDYISQQLRPIELIAKARVLLNRSLGFGFRFDQEKPQTPESEVTLGSVTQKILLLDRTGPSNSRRLPFHQETGKKSEPVITAGKI